MPDHHHRPGNLPLLYGGLDEGRDPLQPGVVDVGKNWAGGGEQQQTDARERPCRTAKDGTTAVVSCRHGFEYTFRTRPMINRTQPFYA